MYQMDNDLRLVDVINDPVALNQFLDFPVYESVESHSLDEVVPNSTEEDFLNFDNCHLGYSSATGGSTDAAEWNFSDAGFSDISGNFFDPSMVSAVGVPAAVNVPAATLPQRCETVAQNLPVGYIPASTNDYSASQSFVQILPSRNNVNNAGQLSCNTVNTDNAIQILPSTNNVITNFAAATSADNSSFFLNSAGSSNGSQVLMNVRPQAIPQNGAVRIQYIQVQNQLPGAMPAGNVVQNIGAAQLPPTNNFKQVQLQQQGHQLMAHGVQGGINLQGTIIPTAAGNRIVIRTGNQQVLDASTGQVNMQGMQFCNSNFVGGTQDARFPQFVQQVTSVQQGVRVQHPQMTMLVGRPNAVAGQVIDGNMSLSGGRQVVLQRTTGVASQNVMLQQLPQQQAVNLPGDITCSQDNKLPDGLVVQIGGQAYRFEPSQQSTGATNVRQGAIFPQSQSVAFSDGSGSSQDPVTMLQQNVQLQQMLIGNQINVLQMLQKQQQQQHQQPKVRVQQFTGSQAGGGSDVIVNASEVANSSIGIVGPVLNRATLASQPLRAQNAPDRTGFDPSLQGSSWATPGLRPSVTTASTSHSGLQFIQPKPAVSVGISGASFPGVGGQPINMLQLGTSLPLTQMNAQPTVSTAGRNVVGLNVQPSAQVITTLSGSQLNLNSGTVQGPQNVQGVVGDQAGQSHAATTVRLSPEQQHLLVKIQSQMKTLLGLSKRNPDQEKYLQMLISGQQQIISQGVSQYLQQQKAAEVKVGSGAFGGNQQDAVMIGQPAALIENSSLPLTSTGNAVTSFTTATSAVSSPSSATVSSSLQNPGQVKAEDLFQALPHLKGKLETHMAKMSPEQRQWFAKNQSVVLAKLLQHHRLQLERDKKEAPPPQQPLNPLTPAQQQQQNSLEANSSSDAAPTRVIRSLNLTRAQKFHLYLQKDQKRATQPEFSKAFENFKDVIRGLVPYHVFQMRDPSEEEVATVEETFEEKAQDLLERKDGMLRKYRLLLMEESMRSQLTSEMVLLERTFHSDEKTLLMNEKRQAEEDPDSFVPRPVLKRLKVEDEDIKKEDESADCKDEDALCGGESVTESTDLKIEARDENVLKLECYPSSPTNIRPMTSSSSVERYKSLQIKLEKLDDTGSMLSKYPYKIGKFDSAVGDVVENLQDEEDDWQERTDHFENSPSEIPLTMITSSCGGFTEDDAAVASLLNTERLNDTSCNFDKRYASKTVNVTVAAEGCSSGFTFDRDDRSSADSSNLELKNSSFANVVADFKAGIVSNEQDTDDLMQGTIDSLMADLTQFNYDLNNPWAANEAKADVPGGNVRQPTNQNALSKRTSAASGTDGCSTESLQYEMQCAIDSIIQLQQPWSGEIGTTSNLPTSLMACSGLEKKNQTT